MLAQQRAAAACSAAAANNVLHNRSDIDNQKDPRMCMQTASPVLVSTQ